VCLDRFWGKFWIFEQSNEKKTSLNALIGRGRLIFVCYIRTYVIILVGIFPLTSPPQPKYWRGCVPGIPGGVDASDCWDSTSRVLSAAVNLLYFSDVLQSRAKLIEETDGMRRQNAELRILLHQYVNSQACPSKSALSIVSSSLAAHAIACHNYMQLQFKIYTKSIF